MFLNGDEAKPWAPNRYKVDFSAESLPSGLYFYRLDSGETSLTKKMLLVK